MYEDAIIITPEDNSDKCELNDIEHEYIMNLKQRLGDINLDYARRLQGKNWSKSVNSNKRTPLPRLGYKLGSMFSLSDVNEIKNIVTELYVINGLKLKLEMPEQIFIEEISKCMNALDASTIIGSRPKTLRKIIAKLSHCQSICRCLMMI